MRADLAAFYIKTHDELAVRPNAAGRSVYENIGETAAPRRGAWRSMPGGAAASRARLAYTYHHARPSCRPTGPASPCPAIRRHSRGQSSAGGSGRTRSTPALTWRYAPRLLDHGRDLRAARRSMPMTATAMRPPGYWVDNLRFGFEQDTGHWHLSEYASSITSPTGATWARSSSTRPTRASSSRRPAHRLRDVSRPRTATGR